MATQLRSGQKLLFIGDSITDCGRRDAQRPLGLGYVKWVADLLTLREPAKRVGIVNKGIGGDNVLGLRSRWSDDVVRERPDWLSVKIGINDLHAATFGGRKDLAPPAFEAAYRGILERTRRELPKCRVLLIDCFYLSLDRRPESQRGQVLKAIPAYLAATARLSREFRTLHIATHALFRRLLQHCPPDVFCNEPVHPNLTGHLAIAEAVYAALS